MQIYADSYYLDFLKPNTFLQFDNIDTIPDSVDLIAITRYNGNLSEHQAVINQLLPKTKKLIVTMIEVINHDLSDFLLSNSDPKIEFFVDADLNCPVPHAKSITSWFMCPKNFYVTSPQAISLLGQLTSNTNKLKFFDCLLGTKKPHRDQIEFFYSKSPYQDKFIFVYFKNDVRNGQWHTTQLDGINFSADLVDFEGWQTPLSALVPVDIYNQSYYSIVAETIALNTHTQYTEKLAKPILAKRLFVVFSGQYYLRNLKRNGFMTFDSVIDESYDAIADDNMRFAQAWQQVEYLCSQDPVAVQHKIKSIVDHNQQHFLTTNWHANMMLTLDYHSGARLP
jgi:hypothetical protein